MTSLVQAQSQPSQRKTPEARHASQIGISAQPSPSGNSLVSVLPLAGLILQHPCLNAATCMLVCFLKHCHMPSTIPGAAETEVNTIYTDPVLMPVTEEWLELHWASKGCGDQAGLLELSWIGALSGNTFLQRVCLHQEELKYEEPGRRA